MSLLRFKALTFDVVGTLIDNERGMLDFLHRADPSRHVPADAFLRAYREARSSPLALLFPDDLERVWAELAREFGLPQEAAAAFRASIADWPAFADSVAALRLLQKHFRLVAATNTQRWAMADLEHTLGDPFVFTVTCDDARREKPDPRFFVSLKERLACAGIRHHEVLHVAQSQYHDVQIAQSLGWRTCWIERRAGRRDTAGAAWPVPRPVRPDWHFGSLRELALAVEAEAAQQKARMEPWPLLAAA